jgi:hypothetical protein
MQALHGMERSLQYMLVNGWDIAAVRFYDGGLGRSFATGIGRDTPFFEDVGFRFRRFRGNSSEIYD